MKNSGFQNAPGLTEFKTGMRIMGPNDMLYGGEWVAVRWVCETGNALCETDRHAAAFLNVVYIPDYLLDLDSIWEGREYEDDHRFKCRVLFVSDSHVAFKRTNGNGLVWLRGDFLAEWKPVPLLPVPTPAEGPAPLAEILQRLREVRDGSTICQMKPAEAFGDIVEALEVLAGRQQKETPQ